MIDIIKNYLNLFYQKSHIKVPYLDNIKFETYGIVPQFISNKDLNNTGDITIVVPKEMYNNIDKQTIISILHEYFHAVFDDKKKDYSINKDGNIVIPNRVITYEEIIEFLLEEEYILDKNELRDFFKNLTHTKLVNIIKSMDEEYDDLSYKNETVEECIVEFLAQLTYLLNDNYNLDEAINSLSNNEREEIIPIAKIMDINLLTNILTSNLSLPEILKNHIKNYDDFLENTVLNFQDNCESPNELIDNIIKSTKH